MHGLYTIKHQGTGKDDNTCHKLFMNAPAMHSLYTIENPGTAGDGDG